MRHYIKYSIDNNNDNLIDYFSKMEKSYEFLNNESNLFEKNKDTAVSTYGYMTFEGIQKLLKKIKEHSINKKNLNFIDLGSGIGRVPVTLSKSKIFKKCIGVELSKHKHDIGLEILNENDLNDKIELINDNIFNYSKFKDIDCIYISSLCFTDKMMNNLLKIFSENLKENCLIFTSKQFNLDESNSRIHLLDTFDIEMSWAKSSKLYCYVIT